MSLSIDDIAGILTKHKLPPDRLNAILTDLSQAEQEKREDKVPGEKTRNQLACVLLDPENKLAGLELAALVVQVPEGTAPNDILPRLYNAAYTQNRDAKRKKWAFKTLVDVVENAKRKFLKEQDVAIKSGKAVVPVIITNGVIPVV